MAVGVEVGSDVGAADGREVGRDDGVVVGSAEGDDVGDGVGSPERWESKSGGVSPPQTPSRDCARRTHVCSYIFARYVFAMGCKGSREKQKMFFSQSK